MLLRAQPSLDEYELLDGRRLPVRRDDVLEARRIFEALDPAWGGSAEERNDAMAQALAFVDALRARRQAHAKLLAHSIPQEIHARVQAWKQAGGREGTRLS
jgi:hypothetical protein